MSQAKTVGPRFNAVFSWGGIVVAIFGLVLAATGSFLNGLIFTAAGVLFWLFAKRRRRTAGLSGLVKLEYLVPHAACHPLDGSRITNRCSLGHPKEPLVVEKEAVGPGEYPSPKAVHEIPVHVEFENRVHIWNESTVIRAAPRQYPEVFPVWVRKNAAGDPDRHPIRHLRPIVIGMIRIVRYDLSLQLTPGYRDQRCYQQQRCRS